MGTLGRFKEPTKCWSEKLKGACQFGDIQERMILKIYVETATFVKTVMTTRSP
jgi:hypothetical protein